MHGWGGSSFPENTQFGKSHTALDPENTEIHLSLHSLSQTKITSVTLSHSHHNKHEWSCLKWIQLILTHALFRNLSLTTRSLTASWWASPVREPTRSGRNPGPARLSRHWGYTKNTLIFTLCLFVLATISPALWASFLLIYMLFVCISSCSYQLSPSLHVYFSMPHTCILKSFLYQFLANRNDKLWSQ